MTRRTGTILLVTAALAVFSSSPAMAGQQRTGARTARPAATVKILKHVHLRADGSAVVVLRTRCRPDVSAFELDVNLDQGDVFGSTTIVEAGVVPCDGHRHRIRVRVVPEAGSFVRGRAISNAFLGVFDQEEGDLEARDSARVRICGARSAA